VSKRLHNKPRSPTQLAADVVEQVLRTDGDPYLRTMEHKLTWWQLALLDVKLFLAMVVVALLFLVGCIAWGFIATLKCVRKASRRPAQKGQKIFKLKSR